MDDLVSRRGTTAEEVLFVLNELRTVPLDAIRFAVITGAYTPHQSEQQDWPFIPGEILPVIHDPDGSREFLGRGRPDPAGWKDSGFCAHHVEDLAAALTVAELVRSDRPRGYYVWTVDGLSYASDQDAAHWAWAGDPDGWVRVDDYTGRAPFAGAGGES
ncbi:hypothetical protein [Streptomyces sp. NPDC020983]|uniref:hypothetical protein n=1 Tax=Streptomyces sp. NPDC020983 TaxID=3365106 RepID=UPI0037B477C7